MKLEMVGPQTQSHLWMEVFFQCIWGDWNPWQNTIKTNHIQFRFLAIRTSFLYSWDRYVEMQNAERPSLPWMIIKLWFLLKVIFLRKKKKDRYLARRPLRLVHLCQEPSRWVAWESFHLSPKQVMVLVTEGGRRRKVRVRMKWKKECYSLNPLNFKSITLLNKSKKIIKSKWTLDVGILVYTIPHTEPLLSKNGLFDGENERRPRFVEGAGSSGISLKLSIFN